MDVLKATAKYEEWVASYVPLVAEDIEFKHEEMGKAEFPFFRATYYRWAQHLSKSDEQTRATPVVLAVGDLHVENYGTWRDAEGRLVWGINDFDEAAQLPYTDDLLR